jgi:hypothetical protein
VNADIAETLAVTRIRDAVSLAQSLLKSSAYLNTVVRVAEAMTKMPPLGKQDSIFRKRRQCRRRSAPRSGIEWEVSEGTA